MRSLYLAMSQLDWRQPWLWPRPYQYGSFVGAGVLGVLLLSPWWLHSWQVWDEVNVAQAKLLSQQETIQALRAQTIQLLQAQSQPHPSFADATVLPQLAQQQGLQFSQLNLDKPQQNAALNALNLQQLPVHLKVQGSWDGWLNWLAQWPTSAPGVTVSSLELKADPRGGISAQVLAVAPRSTLVEPAFELSSVNLDNAAPTDPFSTKGWANTQRAYAEQHPSYARLVAPELLRPREALETFPRERLQYVGQIASGADVQALVKVLPSSGGKKDAPMMSVYRVRVGGYLGQDFGKLLAVHSDQLVLQELVLLPTGEWQNREVRMLLHEALP